MRDWKIIKAFEGNIRLRFMAAIFMLLFVGSILLSTVIAINLKDAMLGSIADSGNSHAAFVAKLSKEALVARDTVTLDIIASDAGRDDVAYVLIYDQKGALMTSQVASINYRSPLFNDMLAKMPKDSDLTDILKLLKARHAIVEFSAPVKFDLLTVGKVVVGISWETVQYVMAKAVLFIFAFNFMMAAVLGLGLYVTSRSIVFKPLSELANSTKKLAAGDLSVRVSMKKAKGEIKSLFDSFNVMVDNLEHATVSKDYVDTIIKSLNDTLFVISEDNLVVSVNDSALSLLAYRKDELLGRPISLVIGDNPSLLAMLSKKIPIYSIETLYRTKGGEMVPMLLSVSVMKGAGISKDSVLVAKDITERRQMEITLQNAYIDLEQQVLERTLELSTANEALRDEITLRERASEALLLREEYFRSLIENSHDIILVADGDGVVTYNSPSVERVLGYRNDEWPGKNLLELFISEDRALTQKLFKEALAMPGAVLKTEARGLHKNGVWRDLAVNGLNLLSMPSVNGVVLNISDITEQKSLRENLKILAHHDSLTGLPNRLLLYDRLDLALSHARRAKQLVALLFLDLDRFKGINDSLGHDSGDQLLKLVSERLRQSVREEDTVARNGGDEFLVMLPGIRDMQSAASVAQKILTALWPPYQLGANKIFVTASIGIALFPSDGQSKEALVKNADMAMYRAKDEGRNAYRFHTSEMDEMVVERMNIEHDLYAAIEQDEFELYYQPKVAAETGRLVGLESLIRWRRGDRLILPAEFIPIAEETGLIVQIGQWAMRAACAQGASWAAMGLGDINISVNLSARQFKQPELIESITDLLAVTGFAASNLDIEITESIAMQNPTLTAKKLNELSRLGISISIDDFGTGYSSLAYLKHFPINTLKIDRSFIRNIISDSNDMAITKTIVAMARTLNMKVVAEGVETLSQLQALKAMKCDEVQGFLISKPLPAHLAEAFISTLCGSSQPL